MRTQPSEPVRAAYIASSPVKVSGRNPKTCKAKAAPVGIGVRSNSGRCSSTMGDDQIRVRTVVSTAAPGFSGSAFSTAVSPSRLARRNSSASIVPSFSHPCRGAAFPAHSVCTVTGGRYSTISDSSMRARRSSRAAESTTISRVEGFARLRARIPRMVGVLSSMVSGAREHAKTASTLPRAVSRIAAWVSRERAREI